jgi:hypothetical protein
VAAALGFAVYLKAGFPPGSGLPLDKVWTSEGRKTSTLILSALQADLFGSLGLSGGGAAVQFIEASPQASAASGQQPTWLELSVNGLNQGAFFGGGLIFFIC